MLSLALSVVAYVVASHFIKRYLDASGIPKGMTRGLFIFVCALAVSYGVAALIEGATRYIAP